MKKILLLILLAAGFTSCRKVINVDLNDAPPALVIEGVVDNNVPAEVRISKSVKFSSNNVFPAVGGAVVRITDDAGGNFLLAETTPGKYTNPALVGVPGRRYSMSVTVEGKNYTAVSIMPQPVLIDTLLFEKLVFGADEIYAVKPQYTDPPGFGNFYKFYERINGKRYPWYWVWDDRFNDDDISTIPIIQTDSTIKLNDTVEIEMNCIDKNVYRYFVALLDVRDNNTVPANPESNITGGCLGYFSAQTSNKKKGVVK
jgi:Domain of unknown function (DUF4249)